MWKLMKFQKKKQRKKIQKPEIKTKNPWTILVWKPSLVQLKGTPSLICIPIWQILISLVSYRCISIRIAYMYHRPDKSTWQLQLCSTEYKKLLNFTSRNYCYHVLQLTACQFLIIFLQKHVVQDNQTPNDSIYG